jgi:hypothetical protein
MEHSGLLESKPKKFQGAGAPDIPSFTPDACSRTPI